MAMDWTFGNNILSDTLAKQSEAAQLPDYGVTNNNDKADDASKGRTIDVMASYGRNNDDSIIIGLLKQVTPDQYCNFNNRNEVFMKRLMIINQKEHDITMNALGTNAAYLGGAFEITNEALSPSYAKDINYKDNFAKNVTSNENKWVESTQMSMSLTRDEYVYNNLYPDDDGTGRFSDTIKTQNPDSILTKTKKLFNTHKINTLISRFHTPPTATQSNLDVTTTYGMSKGRNLLKKNGGTYWVNGYNNPYCRVWTHHYQYNSLDRMIRPFIDNNKPVGVVDFHKWVNFAYKEEKNKDKYGWKTKDNPGWANSVLGNNGFVNITPKYVNGGNSNLHTKQCMFSIENLAWRGYDPYSFENALSWEQRGPMGGRIMWFPPYGIQFTETTNVNWQANTFIGRGEDVYTYANTVRSGNLSFMMVVDHPSIIDYATLRSNIGKGYGEVAESTVKDNDLLRFFAGCDLDTVRNAAQPTPMTDEYANPYYDGFKNLTPPPPPPAYSSNTLYLCVFFPNNSSGLHESNTYDEKAKTKAVNEVDELYDYFKYLMFGAGFYGHDKVKGRDGKEWENNYYNSGGYEMGNIARDDEAFEERGLNVIRKEYEKGQPYDKCSFGLNYDSETVAKYIKGGFEGKKTEFGFDKLLEGNENIFTLMEFIEAIGTEEYKRKYIVYNENDIKEGYDKKHNRNNDDIYEKVFGGLKNRDKIEKLRQSLKQKDLKLDSCEVLGMASFKASNNTTNQENLARERAEVLRDWLCNSKKNSSSSVFKEFFVNGGGLNIKPMTEDGNLRDKINGLVNKVMTKSDGTPDDNNDLANKLTRSAILKFTFDKELISVAPQTEQEIQNDINTDTLLEDVRDCVMQKLNDTIVVEYQYRNNDEGKIKWEIITMPLNKQQTEIELPHLYYKDEERENSNLILTVIDYKIINMSLSNDKNAYYDTDDKGKCLTTKEATDTKPFLYAYIGSCQQGKDLIVTDTIDDCFNENSDWAQVIDIVKNGVKSHLVKTISSNDVYKKNKDIKGVCKQTQNNFNDDRMKRVLVWETLLTGKKDDLPSTAPWCCMLPPVVNPKNEIDLSLIETLSEIRYAASQGTHDRWALSWYVLREYLYLAQINGIGNINIKDDETIECTNDSIYIAEKVYKNGVSLIYDKDHPIFYVKKNDGTPKTYLMNSWETNYIKNIKDKHPLLYKHGCIFDCNFSDKEKIYGAIWDLFSDVVDIEKIKILVSWFYNNKYVTPTITRANEDENKYFFTVLQNKKNTTWDTYRTNFVDKLANVLWVTVKGGIDKDYSTIKIAGRENFDYNYFKKALEYILREHGYEKLSMNSLDEVTKKDISGYICELMLIAYGVSLSFENFNMNGYSSLIVDGVIDTNNDKDNSIINYEEIPATSILVNRFNYLLQKIVNLTINNDKSQLEVSNNVRFYEFEYDVCKDMETLKDVEIPKPDDNGENDVEQKQVEVKNVNNGGCDENDLKAKAQYYYVTNYKNKFVKESYEGLTLLNYDDKGRNVYKDNTTGEIWYKEKDEEKFTRKDLYDEKGNLKALSTMAGHPDSNVNKFRYDQEYHFFRTLEQKNPMVYQELIQKIKYFDPAFHSMTPEGFNARLTFLNQCTRQGNTTTVMDGNVSSANNLAFGRPPFCVLRLGDFYHQMIVIDNISITYDPLVWDLNTEGIGVQPLLANVNISFKFIGGGDMGGPIRRLQNAMSFNYYANASLYDNRADRVQYNWDDTTCGALNHDMIESKSSFYLTPMYDPKNMTSYSDYLRDHEIKHPPTPLNDKDKSESTTNKKRRGQTKGSKN